MGAGEGFEPIARHGGEELGVEVGDLPCVSMNQIPARATYRLHGTTRQDDAPSLIDNLSESFRGVQEDVFHLYDLLPRYILDGEQNTAVVSCVGQG